MTITQIKLYNHPRSYRAWAEPRKSGMRVVVEDMSASFMDIDKDTYSVSCEISWTSYTLPEMVWEVRRMANTLAKQLRDNKIAAQV